MSQELAAVRLELIHLVTDLAIGNDRERAARALVDYLGVEDLVMFIGGSKEGFYQIDELSREFPDAVQLEQFLERCQETRFTQSALTVPGKEEAIPVTGLSDESEFVLILVGKHLETSDLRDLQLVMPLLSAVLQGERTATTANEEADEAARAREEFLTIASHELKTPLTTVKGYIQILQRTLQNPDAPPERVTQAVDQLDLQTRRIEDLVNDLLDVSRIRQGKLELRPEEMDLRDTARRVVSRFEHAPERSKRHNLQLDAPAPVYGEWDPFRIEQLMSNLVSNALKYSTDGGNVRVSVIGNDSRAEVIVEDEGMGISQEAQPQLFQPFFRDPEMKQRVGGTGLGLFITRQIAESHGGEITVESLPGHGSTFTVRLPLEIPNQEVTRTN